MKIPKFINVIILLITLISCQTDTIYYSEDSLNSNKISEKETKPLNPFLKNSHEPLTEFDFKIYNSLEELSTDCSELDFKNFPNGDFFVDRARVPFNRTNGESDFDISYWGLISSSADGSGITLTIKESEFAEQIILEKTYHSGNEELFIGFSTSERIYVEINTVSKVENNLILHERYLGRSDKCEGYSSVSDIDGDGIPDNLDPQPNSNNEISVIIDNCDSGISNFEFGDGYNLSDKIDELEAGNYKNHGMFLSTMAKYLNSLVKTGIITHKDKGSIMSCAGMASY